MLRPLIFGALLSAVPGADAVAQHRTSSTQVPTAVGPDAAARLRVYLECDCFQEYLRDELGWVDFVRQPQDADVHILSSSRETGGGGRELVLRFVGRGRFEAVDTELRVISQAAETENIRRAQVLRTTTVGLLSYLARESLPDGLDLSVRAAATGQTAAAPARDPWNLWVFNVSTGTSFEAEEANRELQWEVNATADRVTDEWKIAFGGRLDEQQRQPWGSLEAGIEWSQYLHDPARYRLEGDAEISLRVVRGLSVNVEGNASRIRDQLSLPRRSATSEEVLLQLRELQSGYEVSFLVGVSYSFGSLFNNVVNPRFGNN